MMRKNIIFQSQESIYGRHLRSKEWIEYKATIEIKDGGKQPVSVDLEFVGIQPLGFEMPPHKKIEAESISNAFVKIMRFLERYDIKMK